MDRSLLSGLGSGLVFGLGLVLSGMSDPQIVLAFLTVAPGWNPALLFVMGSAVITATLGFALVNRRSRPLFDTTFHRPTARAIDGRLLSGAVLFGLGWGLGGFCPGPAIVAGWTLDARAFVFLPAFVIGMWGFEWLPAPVAPTPEQR